MVAVAVIGVVIVTVVLIFDIVVDRLVLVIVVGAYTLPLDPQKPLLCSYSVVRPPSPPRSRDSAARRRQEPLRCRYPAAIAPQKRHNSIAS